MYDVLLGDFENDQLNGQMKALDPGIVGPGDFGFHFATDDLERAREVFHAVQDLATEHHVPLWEGMRIEERKVCPLCKNEKWEQVYPQEARAFAKELEAKEGSQAA